MLSGVGVLDKAVVVLEAIAARPQSLAELVKSTGLTRATAHRLAVALEAHGLVSRDADGRFALGPQLVIWGRRAADAHPLWGAARPVLEALRDETGESVQLFVRQGDRRVCVESLESRHGLRWIVPVGAVLPLDRGSAGRVLLSEAWDADSVPNRRPPWIESAEEREAGVASVSAPVHARDGRLIAAVGISGPLERLSRHPGARFGEAVVRAALAIEAALSDSPSPAHTCSR